jgi:hypothetical protein
MYRREDNINKTTIEKYGLIYDWIQLAQDSVINRLFRLDIEYCSAIEARNSLTT